MRPALAAAGVETQAEWKIDGVNLLPFLTGQKSGAPHEVLYWRFGQQMAIRKGEWKLVKGPGGDVAIEGRGRASVAGAELYNLAQDIGEQKNLAATNPEKVRELAAAWTAWDAQLVEPQWIPQRGAKGGKKKKVK